MKTHFFYNILYNKDIQQGVRKNEGIEIQMVDSLHIAFKCICYYICRIYIGEVAQVAQVISDIYGPDKINYSVYGDLASHLHFHLVPKYKGEMCWGSAFRENEDKKILSVDVYNHMIELIKSNLSRVAHINE